jgi:fucose 4-O-acetylase-like acetyltransferase
MYTALGVVKPVIKSVFLCKLTDFIYAFHMPLFFMLSGSVFALCIENGKYKNTVNFIKNKFRRLVIPYFIFGIFYVTPIMILFHFTDMNVKEYFLNELLLANNPRHLWFILVLFWINVLAILTKYAYNNTALFIALLTASIILCFLSDYITFYFRFRSAAYYQIFFFFGMLLNKLFEKIDTLLKYKQIIAIILGIILYKLFQIDNLLVSVLCGFVGSFMVILLCMSVSHWKLWQFKRTKKLMKNSYGIYFFHPMIIYILYYYLSKYPISPIILCTGIFIISSVISYIFTEITRKLKMEFIIGE